MLQVCLWHSVVGWVRVCKTLNQRRREWGSGRWLTFGFRLVCKGTEDTHKAVRLTTRTNELNSRGSTNIPGMIAGEHTWCESSHRHAEPFIWGGINTCHSVWEAGAQFTSCTPPPTDMTEAPERIRWFKKKKYFHRALVWHCLSWNNRGEDFFHWNLYPVVARGTLITSRAFRQVPEKLLSLLWLSSCQRILESDSFSRLKAISFAMHVRNVDAKKKK